MGACICCNSKKQESKDFFVCQACKEKYAAMSKESIEELADLVNQVYEAARTR